MPWNSFQWHYSRVILLHNYLLVKGFIPVSVYMSKFLIWFCPFILSMVTGIHSLVYNTFFDAHCMFSGGCLIDWTGGVTWTEKDNFFFYNFLNDWHMQSLLSNFWLHIFCLFGKGDQSITTCTHLISLPVHLWSWNSSVSTLTANWMTGVRFPVYAKDFFP